MVFEVGGLFYFISSNKLFHLIDISHRLGRNAETCRIKDYKIKWCVLPVFDPNISLESGYSLKLSSYMTPFQKNINRNELDQNVNDLIDIVGMTRQSLDRYPHEFSGGQRQRISIARALATRPRLLICDEPTSALDVSIQAQILNLLKDIQDELHLTMLFISHDLPVIRQMCNRIIVLKNGTICEANETESLFNNPTHQYTKELINLMPKIESII